MIRYKCAQCDTDMESPDSLAGGKETCPVCKVANWIPQVVNSQEAINSNLQRSGIQPMNCPKCGKEASEYQPNKWQCLLCGRRFIYEPPRQPDSYVRLEQVTTFDDSSFFVCANCGGKFPKHTYAEFTCRKCKKTFCPDHVDKQRKGYCKKCAADEMLLGCFILGVIIIIIVALFALAEGC